MSQQFYYLPSGTLETFQIVIRASPSPHPSQTFLSETAGKTWDVFFPEHAPLLSEKAGEGRVELFSMVQSVILQYRKPMTSASSRRISVFRQYVAVNMPNEYVNMEQQLRF
jgi:hypothetical protein